MGMVSVDITIEQIKKAMRQLPEQDKIALWRLLDEEIDRAALTRRFSAAVNDIRRAYAQIGEEEVLADAIKTTRQSRKAHHAKSRF
ncbi:MAG: hypothetical protein JW908_07385 [Anaerolineales bacterium]|nr:hypothetical protein [Anaerolineales bacterium]